jgi:predicted dehydrogenase
LTRILFCLNKIKITYLHLEGSKIVNIKTQKKLNVAVVGMGFGAEFVPIYLDHPDVESVTICDLDAQRLQKAAERFNIQRCFASFDEMLRAEDIDTVHLVSGIPDHTRQTISALQAGKHCACTVPMATSMADLQAILTAQRASGKNYMMMETAVYTRQFLFAQDLQERGALGRLQFLRGAHYQDMEGWPSYWMGLPPMWYATHAISPLLAIANSRATTVRCLGSGRMRPELEKQYENPYPIESALFTLDREGLAAEVTRTLFHCGRDYMESFVIYGEKACYEWQMEDESPVLFQIEEEATGRGRNVQVAHPLPPDRSDLLPDSIGRYTTRFVYGKDAHHLSFDQGGGHHGSHPHLVHEFVRSIIEKRKPRIDAVTAADWTAAGIAAHESAMAGGREVKIPAFL